MSSIKFGVYHRGLEVVTAPKYVGRQPVRLVGTSSAALTEDDDHDGWLWIGDHHHLTSIEVEELRDRLNNWLATGSLALEEEE